MKLIKLALLFIATAFSVQAQAQRTPVPVVDFANIPVADSTDKPVTAEQLRTAFIRAGSLRRWEIKPVGEGVLEARYVKDGRHTVVATITYTATHYSLAYKDSINMKYDGTTNEAGPHSPRAMQNNMRSAAAAKQAQHFAADPSSRYAVVRPVGELHPFYENWVRNLLGDVRTELRLL